MKEYTILALISVLVAVLLDNLSGVRILKRKEFWILLAIIFLFKFLVNGYLTDQNIVIYGPRFFMGVRLGTIPLEDFLFGFSMVTMTIIFWEHFTNKSAKRS